MFRYFEIFSSWPSCTNQGSFERSSLDTLHEIEIFKGSENTLTMRQTYTYKFQCVFQLSRYPFDTQVAGYGPFRNVGWRI